MKVTHENFEEMLAATRRNEVTLYVPTYTRCTKIDAKCIARFEKGGHTVLKKHSDGNGFLMASGRNFVYVFPGQLVAR